jgi:K+-transporting ATPase A subunit
MYDSDGMGFFAIGILMMGIVYAFLKVFMDNMLIFLIGMAIFAALIMVYIKHGFDISWAISDWWGNKVNRILFKLFGVTLKNKIAWTIYCLVMFAARAWVIIMSILLSLRFLAWVLNQV